MSRTFCFLFLPLLAALAFGSCQPEDPELERPLYPTVGAINARFSVANSATVVFAQGNLQYQATTGQWRFADNQYDVVGSDNSLIDTNNSGWIDLFGWGTSGCDSLMPYTTDDTSAHYARGEADIAGSEYDWGQHNAIANGGGKAGQWRTPTYKEWQHLLFYRQKASLHRALATIRQVGPDGADMGGLVLLPDVWELPDGVEFHPGSAKGFQTNVFSVAQWNLMQSAGAVFLPAGGYRDGTEVALVGDFGCYWTTSSYTSESAYELYFQSLGFNFYTTARATGHSVRLIMDK